MSLSKRLTRQTARFISATLMTALATILLAPVTQAQDVSVDISDESGVVGETVTVPIEVSNLDDAAGIISYSFDVDLDTSNVAYVGVDASNTLTEAAGLDVTEFNVDNDQDPRVAATGTDTLNAEGSSGVLLRLELEILETATSTVTLSGFEFNSGDPAATPSEPSFSISGAENLVTFPQNFSARDSGQASPEDTVLVPVQTSDLTGLGVVSFGFDMEYDPSVIEPIKVVTENSLSAGRTTFGGPVEGSSGVFRVGAAGSEDIEGEGTLIFVQMEVKSTGTSPLAFVPGTFEFNDGSPTAATRDGMLTADELNFTLGDPTLNGSVSGFDASLVLKVEAGIIDTLSAAQEAAADVTQNGEISGLDASQILQFVVGACDEFPCEIGSGSAKTQTLASSGQLEWGTVETSGGTSALPVQLSGSVSNVRAVSLTLKGDVEALDVGSLSDRLPEGWQVTHNTFAGEDKAKVVMAGVQPISETGELVRLPLESNASSVSIEGMGTINESAQTTLGPAPVAEQASSFALQGNFPNPVTQSTAITFDVPQTASVEVEVYDLLGRRVLSIPSRTVPAGEGRSIQIDASDLSSGAYFYRLKAETDGGESDSWTGSGRMVVVK